MKILIILPRIPYPIEKGDKLRAYHQIKHLSKKNEIILVAINDCKIHKDAHNELEKYVKHFHFFNISKIKIFINLLKTIFSDKAFQIGYYYHKNIQKKIYKLVDIYKPDHVYCQLVRTAFYAENINLPKTIDYQDAFSKGLERRVRNATFWKKPILKIEYKRMQKAEKRVFEIFDNKTIISAPDRALIPHHLNNKIHIISNGVDTDYFHPNEDAEKKYDVVFTGNMAYPPNIDCAEFLSKEVLPKIREKKPDAKLLIAGATPHKRVKALSSEFVKISGWMDDIREAYWSAKIFAAPMRIGIGLQNKLLEAMATEMPCVSSSFANNALSAKQNHEIMIGDEANIVAEQILFLLNNSKKAKVIAENGRNFVLKNYNWQSSVNKLEKLFHL